MPVPGIWCTNALGQVGLRGNAHLAQVIGTDPRLTGRRTIFVDGAAQADGSSIIYGPVYHEVGTWDGTGTNFTPAGGMWEISYRGTMGTDGSLQLHVVGAGWGGTIDGLRLDETLTRVAGPIMDPTIPYLYTGTIKPAPVNTSEVVDNFDDNTPTGWTWGGSGTSFPLLEINHQFTVRGWWPGLVTQKHFDTWDWPYLRKNWSVANNRTLECRVDLVSMSENATNAAGIVLWSSGPPDRSCIFIKGRDFVQVGKWVGNNNVAVFFHEKAVIKNTNVVLSLALTRVDPNVVVTVRVLDKDNQEAVLYQRSVVDTPQADRTLTSAELLALSGMNLSVLPDVSGPPLSSGNAVFLHAFQYTDGTQPQLDVTYDNLELRTSEVPGVGIERAVRLSWPVSSIINYAVEGAPTVQGPWLPVQDTAVPGMNQMTAPASELMQFFRLRQSP